MFATFVAMHLFINRKTGMPYTTISKTFARLTTKANLRFWSPHSCRLLICNEN
jgi:hypothetical protein